MDLKIRISDEHEVNKINQASKSTSQEITIEDYTSQYLQKGGSTYKVLPENSSIQEKTALKIDQMITESQEQITPYVSSNDVNEQANNNGNTPRKKIIIYSNGSSHTQSQFDERANRESQQVFLNEFEGNHDVLTKGNQMLYERDLSLELDLKKNQQLKFKQNNIWADSNRQINTKVSKHSSSLNFKKHKLSTRNSIASSKNNSNALEHFYVNKQRAMNFSFQNMNKYDQQIHGGAALSPTGFESKRQSQFQSPMLELQPTTPQNEGQCRSPFTPQARNRTQHMLHRKNLHKQIQNRRKADMCRQEFPDLNFINYPQSEFFQNSELKDYSIRDSNDITQTDLKARNRCRLSEQVNKLEKAISGGEDGEAITTMLGTNMPMSNIVSLDDRILDGESSKNRYIISRESNVDASDSQTSNNIQSIVKSLHNVAKNRYQMEQERQILSEPRSQQDKRIKKNWFKESFLDKEKKQLGKLIKIDHHSPGTLRDPLNMVSHMTMGNQTSTDIGDVLKDTLLSTTKNSVEFTTRTYSKADHKNDEFLENRIKRKIKYGSQHMQHESNELTKSFMFTMDSFHKEMDLVEMNKTANYDDQNKILRQGSNAGDSEKMTLMNLKTNHNFEMQKIYIDSLQNLIQNMPIKIYGHTKMMGDLQFLMNRIKVGIEETFITQKNLFTQVIADQQRCVKESQQQVETITEEFNVFQKNNNLDEYFEKSLTHHTRSETLKMVNELLQNNDKHNWDWLSKIQELKEELGRLKSSETEETLQLFHKELVQMSTAGGKLKLYEEDNLKSEKFLEHRLAFEKGTRSPPLKTEGPGGKQSKHRLTGIRQETLSKFGEPPVTEVEFASQLKRYTDTQYNTGIYETGKRVCDRLIKYYVRPQSEACTQTDSKDAVMTALLKQCEKLIEEKEKLKDEVVTLTRQNEKYLERSQDLLDQKKSLRQGYDELLVEYEFLKAKYDDYRLEKLLKDREIEQYKALWKRFKIQAFESDVKLRENQLYVDGIRRQLDAKDKMIHELRDQDMAIKCLKLENVIGMQKAMITQIKKQFEDIKKAKDKEYDIEESVNLSSLESRRDQGQLQKTTKKKKNAMKKALEGSSSESIDISEDEFFNRNNKGSPYASPTPGLSKTGNSFMRQMNNTSPQIQKGSVNRNNPSFQGSAGNDNKSLSGSQSTVHQRFKRSPGAAKKKILLDDSDDNKVNEGSENDTQLGDSNQSIELKKVGKLQSKISLKKQKKPAKNKQLKKVTKKEDFETDETFQNSKSSVGPDLMQNHDIIGPARINNDLQDQLDISIEEASVFENSNVKVLVRPNEEFDMGKAAALTTSRNSPSLHLPSTSLKGGTQRTEIAVEVATAQTNTDPLVYIAFACNMFLDEIRIQIADFKSKEDIDKMKELLRNSQHIIDRIKSKAASPYGVTVLGRFSTYSYSGPDAMLGTNADGQMIGPTGAVITRQPFSTQGGNNKKVWHFDVGQNTSKSPTEDGKEKRPPQTRQNTQRTMKGSITSRNTSDNQAQKTQRSTYRSNFNKYRYNNLSPDPRLAEGSKELEEKQKEFFGFANKIIQQYSVGTDGELKDHNISIKKPRSKRSSQQFEVTDIVSRSKMKGVKFHEMISDSLMQSTQISTEAKGLGSNANGEPNEGQANTMVHIEEDQQNELSIISISKSDETGSIEPIKINTDGKFEDFLTVKLYGQTFTSTASEPASPVVVIPNAKPEVAAKKEDKAVVVPYVEPVSP